MLRTRHLVILAVVLAALALVAFLQQARHEATTSRAPSATLVPRTWTADELSRVTLGYGEEPEIVVMSAGPQEWSLDTRHGAEVNRQRLDGLLRAVSELSGEFRSDAADVLPDYGLTDTASVLVRGYDGEGAEAFALRVGDRPTGQSGEFVRRPEETSVYLTDANLLGALGLYQGPERPSGRHFLQMQILELERRDVDAVTLRDEHGERRLVKEFAVTQPAEDDTTGAGPQVDRLTWEWRLGDADGPMLAKTRADAVLGAACRIRAADVGDPTAPDAAYGLDEPSREVMLHMPEDSTLTLRFGDSVDDDGENAAGTWMRIDDAAEVWLVNDYSVRNIFKTEEELLPES